jgi:DNA polymerase III subunit gamma/tau
MSHQVLARKWRPRDFGSLVGQEHVVRALTHALDTNRLHHAYLFTGTRGVGKTTIARILAKSLNCETGVASTPCGRCGACTAIDQGRFPDYLELDAASNRGVDEMAQLLDNAVYAPVSGRYKVYVIDEVHMLTAHAFNAMLKTLEEPPGHVVFILATTDPQKVPVTVLSRCLQFNLKNVPAPAIAAHLGRVLEAEGVRFEPEALSQVGRAAAGSMRDALSLLDQAIAYGGGRVDDVPVREMLGVVDRHDLERLLEALSAGDGPALVALADDMLGANAPFERVLLDLAALVQRIALRQVGVAVGDGDDIALLDRHASSMAPEDLQVYYQIAIHGVRDLPLAPDPHAGFTMTLLRLLAFRPDSARPARPGVGAAPAGARPPAAARAAPVASAPVAAALAAPAAFDGDWAAFAASLPRTGLIGQFVHQSELIGHDRDHFRLRVPIKQLAEPGTVAKVRDALSHHLGQPVRLTVEVGAVQGATAAAARAQQQAELQAQAHATIEGDAFVRTLLTEFDGTILPESVQPISPTGEPQ